MHHVRKIRKKYYKKVLSGEKPWELRKEDIDKFEPGDTLSFTTCKGRPRKGVWEIPYVLRYEDFPWGIQPMYAILSLKKIK